MHFLVPKILGSGVVYSSNVRLCNSETSFILNQFLHRKPYEIHSMYSKCHLFQIPSKLSAPKDWRIHLSILYTNRSTWRWPTRNHTHYIMNSNCPGDNLASGLQKSTHYQILRLHLQRQEINHERPITLYIGSFFKDYGRSRYLTKYTTFHIYSPFGIFCVQKLASCA